MKNIENFKIDFNPKLIKTDYWLYFTKKSKQKILALGIGFLLALIVYFLLYFFTKTPLLTSFALGIMTFLLLFILFDLIDLFLIRRKLKKIEKLIPYGKRNLVVKNNSIEIIHPTEKRVIFLSQLTKIIRIKKVFYFIEKKSKKIPFKINKAEMSDSSFEQLMTLMKTKKVKIKR